MSKKILIGVVIGICLTLILSIIGNGKPDEKMIESAAKTAKLVKVETVTMDKVKRLSEISAVLEANEETIVSFEVPGRLLEMRYKEGDQVTAGTVLARINATEYSIQVAQADAGVNKSQVAYQQALQDFERVEQLYQAGAVSQSEYEKVYDRLQVAEEDYTQARESARLLGQNKTQLVAPISGTILAKHITQGQTTAAGSPVYSLGRLNPLKAVLPVPDKDLSKWREGDIVTLNLYDQERQGQVVQIYPATNRGTGTVGVEVTIPNPEHNWLPGQVVMAKRTETREGLYVPVSAVINRGEEKPFVFLALNGKAVKRSVTIGELFGDNMEITSGLKAGDKIVVKGAEQLFEDDTLESRVVATSD